MVDNDINKTVCACKSDIEERRKQVEDESFAMTLLRECNKNAHRWFIFAMVILIFWLATIGSFVWFLSQYEFVDSNYSMNTEQSGGVNIAGNGDVDYGTSDSTDSVSREVDDPS